MPHVCGDEPPWTSSQMTWNKVCPTCVGMNRMLPYENESDESMPHVCGDEPIILSYQKGLLEYAPRMWG